MGTRIIVCNEKVHCYLDMIMLSLLGKFKMKKRPWQRWKEVDLVKNIVKDKVFTFKFIDVGKLSPLII
jgi:hypothetical protein